MAKKRRKSVYIQPPHEQNSKRPRTSRPSRPVRSRTPQELPLPTVRRTARMLPIYFVVMFGLQYLLTGGQDLTTVQRLANAMVVATMVSVIFFPVLHLMEKSRYKRLTKMRDKAQQESPSGKNRIKA